VCLLYAKTRSCEDAEHGLTGLSERPDGALGPKAAPAPVSEQLGAASNWHSITLVPRGPQRSTGPNTLTEQKDVVLIKRSSQSSGLVFGRFQIF